ncbi:unnamed protein product [Cladocopium goreaui]|uniref:Leucine-rich repeat and WD repeat-containing protein 1 n=1 Tax=Cladocopium goreaui TaxID=2562237 RepID=A0A9P1CXY0_9DINO|nr:unnamed protein product [Cladocopium goreaui]
MGCKQSRDSPKTPYEANELSQEAGAVGTGLLEVPVDDYLTYIYGLRNGDFAVAGGEGWLYIYSSEGKQTVKLRAHRKAVNRVLEAADGSLFSASSDGTVLRWKGLKEGQEIQEPVQKFEGHILAVSAMDLLEAGLFTGSRDCCVMLWDLETAQSPWHNLGPEIHGCSVELLAMVEQGKLRDGCEEVRCNFCPLKGSELSALGRRLADAPFRTRSLDLCYCQLGALGLYAFSSQFCTSRTPSDDGFGVGVGGLAQLSLGANGLGSKGAQLAAELVLKMKLQRLDLESNELQDEGCRILSQKALQSNKCTLQHLDLRMNGIRPDGAAALAKALMNNRTLTHLDLGYNRIGTTGAEALCTVLKTSNVQVLRLEDNDVKDQGAMALVALQLQVLELGFNQALIEFRAVLLAAQLCGRGTRGPKRLGLGGNDLRDAGAAAFAAALQKNCCLEDAVKTMNWLFRTAALAAQALERFSGSKSQLPGGAALASALQSNWRLRELDLRDNEISSEAARIIDETTSCARLASAKRPSSPERIDELLVELSTGTRRRFCSAWSVRAYLSWLTKDLAQGDENRRHLVAAALASAIVDVDGLWYELPRLRELSSLYGRKLRGGSRARAQGLYVLNLTPFRVTVTASPGSKHSARALEENTGGALGDVEEVAFESLQFSQKTARGLQSMESLKVDNRVGTGVGER